MKRAPGIAAALLGVTAAVAATEPQLPAFELVRADETWNELRDPSLRELAPAFKFLPLDADASAFLSLGGELRERFDGFDTPRYGLEADPDSYLLQRLLLHADLHFSDRARVFVQLGYESVAGKEGALSPSDADHGDLQNFFLDLSSADARARLRVGRQELLFNPTQRFVSVREAPNVRQSFDGLRFTWTDTRVRLDGFVTRPVEYSQDSFDDHSDSQQLFYGLYATVNPQAAHHLEFYYLGLQRDEARFRGVVGRERRHSVGARMAGRADGWDYDVEGVTQFGQFNGQSIRAWALGAIAGYTWHRAWSPRLGFELDAGSGDRDGADGRLETFNPLFPKGAYFNDSGLNSWANGVYFRTSLSARPIEALTLYAALLARWREEPGDAIYLQPYVPLLPPSPDNRATSVGQALELRASWKASRSLTFSTEFVRQRADEAIRQAGGADSSFYTLVTQYRF